MSVDYLTPDEARLVDMMKALGNPNRMWIVRFLLENDVCMTGDIVAASPLSQATVSQHLKVLREAGLIYGRAEGQMTNYCCDENALAWFKEKSQALL
jgi:ArsR family transcriptional regulator, arsenate/arsenite/antimonite-responsive transcriptional repressor